MVVSNFMLIEANQIAILAKLQMLVGTKPGDAVCELNQTYKQIDNLKELMVELNKPQKIFTLGHQG